jgi:hypothetical protein
VKKVYAPYLTVIQESIAAVESYRPVDKETFLASPVLQDALLMRLQVIGENLAQMTKRSISRGFGRSSRTSCQPLPRRSTRLSTASGNRPHTLPGLISGLAIFHQ